MRIALDISQIVYAGTGVARFTNGLLQAILDYDVTNTWTFFFSGLNRKLDAKVEAQITAKGHRVKKLPLSPNILSKISNDFHNQVFSNMLLPKDLDWFISSDWTEPPMNCKKATIVHDLTFVRYPETVDTLILKTQKKRLEWVKKESKVIFADSAATKQDLIDLMNIRSDVVTVNYPGVNVIYPTTDEIEATLKKYKINQPYFLSVGKLEPRKNLSRLLAAFEKATENGCDNLSLIIVGPKGWDNLKIQNSSAVRCIGQVADDELYSLYTAAMGFVFPSIWEGFGYPAIEAMKCGAPTILSATSSLLELGENATVFFDPMDVDSIARALQKVAKDDQLRDELRKKGLERAQTFTWKRYVDTLCERLASTV